MLSTACLFVLILLLIAPWHEADTAFKRPEPGTMLLTQSRDPGLPIHLRIPGIDVGAAIESVGLTSKGAMDVPTDPNNVGWYHLGPRPGEQGSAVLAGHLDWYGGKTAVFQYLNKLREGDLLTVETDNGRFFTFVVREIRTYHPDEYVPEVFQNNDGAHLNLITCGGDWDSARKIYKERLVVFTDLVEPAL